MKPDKLFLSDQDTDINIIVDNQTIFNSSCEKILGINVDKKLKFNTHVTKLCKKASQKLHALARMSNFMSVNQKQLIINAFIYSQFNYCPVISMCHSRSLTTKINRIHERALRIVYNNNCSSFDVLLQKCESVTLHHRNIQKSAIEIYKALHNLSSSLMAEIFTVKGSGYKLRGGNKLISDNIKTVNYGKETISYLAPKIWEHTHTHTHTKTHTHTHTNTHTNTHTPTHTHTQTHTPTYTPTHTPRHTHTIVLSIVLKQWNEQWAIV